MMQTITPDEHDPLSLSTCLAVALVSGAIIAYELFVMRVFANGGWSHFGSTVISIAMFGFGFYSTALCIWKEYFKKRLRPWVSASLLLLGPAMAIANSGAQKVPFNPIFLVSDPAQKYYLAAYFLLYFLPFLLGAMFLGLFFLMGQRDFGKAYFANMTGSGIGGMAIFGGMYCLLPERLFLIPVLLWVCGAVLWLKSRGSRKELALLAVSALLTAAVGLYFPQINVSQYKGVSYARNFPDAHRVYESASPFGYLEVYSSSYFHFAPGLSDVAMLYLDKMPEKAYLGMYIDGDGPVGLMKKLSESEAEYLEFLPMSMPYLLKKAAEVLVMQFGGGISTNVALDMGARHVTVAEGNPMVIEALRDRNFVSRFTGAVLENPKVRLIQNEGRIYVGQTEEKFDVIDLSLADSTGLSMSGGSSIYEKYTYTKETFLSCMRALRKDGLLAVTVWNKEDPPKSTLKLMNTLIRAAGDARNTKDVRDAGNVREPSEGPDEIRHDFFIAHTYLSTLTVLYKKGGFSDDEVLRLRKYCKRMSFETIYFPGCPAPKGSLDRLFGAYVNAYFAPQENEALGEEVDMSAGSLYRHVVERFLSGDFKSVEKGYVFNVDALTNDRPYFAGFVKFPDIPRFVDKLEAISDEWGYLLLWATLLLSVLFGLALMLLPLIFGSKAFFSRRSGKLSVILYFLCLGVGYILVEIGMIGKTVLCLGNATVSVAVLVTGMLVFSGLGSYASGRFASRAGSTMIVVCSSLAVVLFLYAFSLDRLFELAGSWPYAARILFCLLLLFPPAFLMGFPFAIGMVTLSRLQKERFFVWAWGINGSFSVAGSVLAPVIAVSFGLSTVIVISALLYLVALPSFFRLRMPERQAG